MRFRKLPSGRIEPYYVRHPLKLETVVDRADALSAGRRDRHAEVILARFDAQWELGYPAPIAKTPPPPDHYTPRKLLVEDNERELLQRILHAAVRRTLDRLAGPPADPQRAGQLRASIPSPVRAGSFRPIDAPMSPLPMFTDWPRI